MPGERLKFRCYRCNQLLAVVGSKAGSIVACPKCQADLVVPQPDSPAAVNGPSGEQRATNAGALPAFLQNIDSEIPADLADLRPEDLRVEAEVFANLSHSSAAATSTATASADADSPYEVQTVSRRASASPAPSTSRAQPASFSPREIDAAAEPREAQLSSTIMVSEPIVPPIEIDTPALLAPAHTPRVVREVVLPASVVLAWSLFVLIAIALAFVAGLMVGHFLWKPA
jgi:hypothetical protein